MGEWGGTTEKDFHWSRFCLISSTSLFVIITNALAVVWTGVLVVMLLPSICIDTRLDSPCWICAFPEWLASQKISPAAMEEVVEAEAEVDRAAGEGVPGVAVLQGARGCTSSRWLNEPGQWPYTTPTLSNKTASPSTAPCSSSARTTSFGSMQNESPSGHILNITFDSVEEWTEVVSNVFVYVASSLDRSVDCGVCQHERLSRPTQGFYWDV